MTRAEVNIGEAKKSLELGPNQRHFYAERLIDDFRKALSQTPELRDVLTGNFLQKTPTHKAWRVREKQTQIPVTFKRNGAEYTICWDPMPGKNELRIGKLLRSIGNSCGWVSEESISLTVKEDIKDPDGFIEYYLLTPNSNPSVSERNTYQAVSQVEAFLKELKRNPEK